MSSSSSTSQNFLEDLDAEFYCAIKTAKAIVEALKRPKDREIASHLINRVRSLNSNSLAVKTNRNEFTKYFIKVLQKTEETQPSQYDQWFKPKERKHPKETALWSADHRTYVATKTIPGFGMLVYLAVSNEPHLGWQDNGFLNYKF